MAVAKRRQTRPSIIAAADPATTLAAWCPDLQQWPHRWRGDDSDLPCGRQLIAIFTPFLLDLIAQGVARKTFVRHRDRLWMLGGQIIRHRQQRARLSRLPAAELLRQQIDSDGGPLLSSVFLPEDQASFDATCRKLYRFLLEQSGADAGQP